MKVTVGPHSRPDEDGIATGPVSTAKVVTSSGACSLAGGQSVQQRTVKTFDDESLIGIAIDGRLTTDAQQHAEHYVDVEHCSAVAAVARTARRRQRMVRESRRRHRRQSSGRW